MTRRAGQVLLALIVVVGALAGCAPADGGAATGRPGPDPVDTGRPGVGRSMPHELYTHCGIDGARIGPTYFEAEVPLSDGSGNPPEGWGNPVQPGTMTLTSETEAVFTDDAGHEVAFRARPGADAPERVCA
ncbi:hypothetical protein ACFY40_08190 [Streptomyces sp. NPDC012950]|uniref:hypothetical protein n=1 Tax=Streptomyces sp. NPDC012950 TaxID=3364858 RepID=UPI0036D0E87C